MTFNMQKSITCKTFLLPLHYAYCPLWAPLPAGQMIIDLRHMIYDLAVAEEFVSQEIWTRKVICSASHRNGVLSCAWRCRIMQNRWTRLQYTYAAKIWYLPRAQFPLTQLTLTFPQVFQNNKPSNRNGYWVFSCICKGLRRPKVKESFLLRMIFFLFSWRFLWLNC